MIDVNKFTDSDFCGIWNEFSNMHPEYLQSMLTCSPNDTGQIISLHSVFVNFIARKFKIDIYDINSKERNIAFSIAQKVMDLAKKNNPDLVFNKYDYFG